MTATDRAKRALLALAAAGALAACAGDGGDVRRTFYAGGGPWSELRYRDGAPHGLWTTWYENGQKKSEGKYARGLQEGPWRFWNEGGQLLLLATYRHDRPNGLWEAYWDDGSPKYRGAFLDSVRDGQWTEWYQGGGRSSEGHYESGEREGLWRMWTTDGVLAAESQVSGGRAHGKQMLRMESGIVRTGECVDGLEEGLWTFWFREYPEVEKKAGEASFSAGAYHGTHTQWNEEGEVVSRGEWRHGKRHGRWVVYAPDGSLNTVDSGLYEDGVKVAD